MYQVIHSNVLDWAKEYSGPKFSAVLCDPPYHLSGGFMGKDWDSFRATRNTKSQVVTYLGSGMRAPKYSEMVSFQEWCTEWATEALRVAKPGCHMLAFGGTRTFHRLAVAIEDAGWEIRDTIMWVYAQGFPKSYNIGCKCSGSMVQYTHEENEHTPGRRPAGMAESGRGCVRYDAGRRCSLGYRRTAGRAC